MTLTDIWADLGYKVPHVLTGAQEAVLARNPQYRAKMSRGGKCVVCKGEGRHVWDGVEMECPDDDYGHAATRLNHWYWVHNIPLQYQQLDWRDFPTDTAAKGAAKGYVDGWLGNAEEETFAGRGMNITSKIQGTGKTWIATAVQKELTKHGYDTWFIRFLTVVGLYQEEDRAKKKFLEGKIKNAAVLFVDEVKPGRSDDQIALYAEKLEELIRPRDDENLTTFLTTNMNRAQLEQAYDRTFNVLAAKNDWVSLEGEMNARVEFMLWEKQAEASANGWRRPIT